jgi:hypothetical protein
VLVNSTDFAESSVRIVLFPAGQGVAVVRVNAVFGVPEVITSAPRNI